MLAKKRMYWACYVISKSAAESAGGFAQAPAVPVEPGAKRPPSFWNDVEKQAFLDAFKVSLLTLLFLFSVVGKRVLSFSV